MTDRRLAQPRRRPRGFTLTELLIVMGIIVLLATLALPAFRLITGARSQDAAQNQIAAILGRARSDAIALQEDRGVFFYQESGANRIGAAIVHSRPDVSSVAGAVVLDLLPNRESLLLPIGVGLQVLGTGTTTSGDRYVGFNKSTSDGDTTVPYGGVILFDAQGRITIKTYSFLVAEKPGTTAVWTEMGKVLYDNPTAAPPTAPKVVAPKLTPAPITQLGFVLYDTEPFNAMGFTADDPSPTDKAEETWLDTNGLPFLINRYNGTLLRAQ